jgi:hypothetical protein
MPSCNILTVIPFSNFRKPDYESPFKLHNSLWRCFPKWWLWRWSRHVPVAHQGLNLFFQFAFPNIFHSTFQIFYPALILSFPTSKLLSITSHHIKPEVFTWPESTFVVNFLSLCSSVSTEHWLELGLSFEMCYIVCRGWGMHRWWCQW